MHGLRNDSGPANEGVAFCVWVVCVYMCVPFYTCMCLLPASACGGSRLISLLWWLLTIINWWQLGSYPSQGQLFAQKSWHLGTQGPSLWHDGCWCPASLWGWGNLLLFCLIMCASLTFTQSSEKGNSRWEGSIPEKSLSTISSWKAVNECGFSDVIKARSFYHPWQPSLEK